MDSNVIKNKHLLDSIIALTILSAYCMISLSFFLNIQQATYFLFVCIALSILGYLIVFINIRDQLINIALLFGIITLARYFVFFGTVKLVDSLIVISVVFFAATVYKVQLTKNNVVLLVVGALPCAILLIVKMNDSSYLTYQGWLQYVYQNTNTAGSVALNLLVVLLIGAMITKKRLQRVLLWLCVALLFLIIIKTHARASFISAIAFVILSVFYLLKIKILFTDKPVDKSSITRRNMTIANVLLLSPVILLPIFTLFSNVLFPQGATLLDKTLFSGREHMWGEAIVVAFNNLIHFKNEYVSGLNTALKLIYLSGLLGTCIFFSFFLKAEKASRIHNPNKKRTVNFSFLAMGVLFLEQSFESTIVSGSYAICYISMCMLGLVDYWGKR